MPNLSAMERSAAVRSEYNKLASSYDPRWSRYIDATLKETLDAVDFRGNERVLDVPVGTGELAARLREKWPSLQISGVDLSPEILKQAAEKSVFSTEHLHEACVAKLPFPDNEFDCVFCINSFHYFSRPKLALVEIRRVLRDGGQLILVDWCDDYFTCKLCSLWLRISDSAFHRTYTRRKCEASLKQGDCVLTQAPNTSFVR